MAAPVHEMPGMARRQPFGEVPAAQGQVPGRATGAHRKRRSTYESATRAVMFPAHKENDGENMTTNYRGKKRARTHALSVGAQQQLGPNLCKTQVTPPNFFAPVPNWTHIPGSPVRNSTLLT